MTVPNLLMKRVTMLHSCLDDRTHKSVEGQVSWIHGGKVAVAMVNFG